MATKPPPLYKKDFTSETWDRIRARVQHRLVALRDELEGEIPPETTAKLRGRIAELRELLALAKAPAQARRPGDRISAADLADATVDPLLELGGGQEDD